jgi:short-subunit dehydrogenase
MIARNQQKLTEASAKVRTRFPRVKIVTISADLSKMVSIHEYKEKIVHKIKDLDVAMLFLNAGVAQMGKF